MKAYEIAAHLESLRPKHEAISVAIREYTQRCRELLQIQYEALRLPKATADNSNEQ